MTNSKRNENVSYNKNSTQIGLLKNTGIGIAEETSGNTEHKNWQKHTEIILMSTNKLAIKVKIKCIDKDDKTW